ncbi:DUF2948 family protein [Kordiimonas laminariae]|uniref:DUF2948 family protein n=1 Tax=Kordiimonas laminariae TaxID=2917717 RepID=UPI001FF52A5E|nr:DUF2948 family protein [Kordiimonas laminariae]MCK0070748.1 DUF2948 family protein [Kordiimonas laminariae]
MSKPQSDILKLVAQNPDDLTVISALLQDMVIRVGDIAWLPEEKRFAAVGNRYRWEKKRLFRKPKGERIRTGFHFSSVNSAQLSGIDLSEKESFLELLSVEAVESDAGFFVILNFAGGPAIKLAVEAIDAVASDLSEGWEAIARPTHSL